jgi:hypothetical protein
MVLTLKECGCTFDKQGKAVLWKSTVVVVVVVVVMMRKSRQSLLTVNY